MTREERLRFKNAYDILDELMASIVEHSGCSYWWMPDAKPTAETRRMDSNGYKGEIGYSCDMGYVFEFWDQLADYIKHCEIDFD